MDFLIVYYNQAGVLSTSLQGNVSRVPAVGREPADLPSVIEDWLPVIIVFAFCTLDLLRPGIAHGKKIHVLGDKRVAA